MLLRLIMLLSVFGLMVGPNAGGSDTVEPGDDREMGGEGFGRLIGFLAFLGVVLLAIVLILALLSVFDVFIDDLRDPEA